jgi:hypothetical protein
MEEEERKKKDDDDDDETIDVIHWSINFFNELMELFD